MHKFRRWIFTFLVLGFLSMIKMQLAGSMQDETKWAGITFILLMVAVFFYFKWHKIGQHL